MGDNEGLVASAVRIIACSVREDFKWGARAFQLWSKGHGSPSECVATAQQELYGPTPSKDDYSPRND